MHTAEQTTRERATVEWLRSKLTCPIDWKTEIGIESDLDVSLDLHVARLTATSY